MGFVKEIDNRGLPCPEPVLNTKRAMDELREEDSTLISIVDNAGAKENILRYVKNAGGWSAHAEKREGAYYIRLERSGAAEPAPRQEGLESAQCIESRPPVFLITTNTLGSGSEELGKILMRSFIATLKEGPVYPERVMLLNTGVYLAVEGSPVLEDLIYLEERGVEVFSCGTCLDYFNLKDKLKVGRVTNMFATVESLLKVPGCVSI